MERTSDRTPTLDDSNPSNGGLKPRRWQPRCAWRDDLLLFGPDVDETAPESIDPQPISAASPTQGGPYSLGALRLGTASCLYVSPVINRRNSLA